MEREATSCYGVRRRTPTASATGGGRGVARVPAGHRLVRAAAGAGLRLLHPADALQGINPVSLAPVVDAALHHLQAWMCDGTPPPVQPRIEFGGDPPAIVRDDDGIAGWASGCPASRSLWPTTALFSRRRLFAHGVSRGLPGGEGAPARREPRRHMARYEQALRAAEAASVCSPPAPWSPRRPPTSPSEAMEAGATRPSRVPVSLRPLRRFFAGHRMRLWRGLPLPDRDTYPALFAWDSGYHALSLLPLAPDAAVEELTSSTGPIAPRRAALPSALCPRGGGAPALHRGPVRADVRRRSHAVRGSPHACLRRGPAVPCPGAPADHLLDDAVAHLRPGPLGRWTAVVAGGAAPVRDRYRGERPDGGFTPRWAGRLPADSRSSPISARAADMAPERPSRRSRLRVYDPTLGWYLLALEEVAAACRARGGPPRRSELEAMATVVARVWRRCSGGIKDASSSPTTSRGPVNYEASGPWVSSPWPAEPAESACPGGS